MTVSTGQPARTVPTSARKRQLAGSLRRVADQHAGQLPETIVHKHLRDAAARLDRGDTHGAIRHLQTAAHALTPQSMYRHGVADDGGHQAARRGMYEVTRHILLIKDVADDEAGNASVLARRRESAIMPPPPGKAINAPATTNSGGPGNEANGPAEPPPTTGGVKEHTAPASAVELVGPHGYVHGWKYVGGPGLPPGPGISTFGAGTHPGSFEHINAIEDFGRRAAISSGDPAHASPTMGTALHNVAVAVAQRDMPTARVHLQSAEAANRSEAGGMWTRDLHALRAQLGQVPHRATGWQGQTANPLKPHGQHPGRYRDPAHGIVPSNPTANALQIQFAMILAHAIELAGGTWPDAATVLELSAQTGALATIPHPFGRPGGPGLWNVKGMELPPYIQNIAHALLRTGRARDLGHAIAIAKAATSRWARGKNTKPEVRAASAATNADWEAKRARAHASK